MLQVTTTKLYLTLHEIRVASGKMSRLFSARINKHTKINQE